MEADVYKKLSTEQKEALGNSLRDQSNENYSRSW